MGRDNLLRAANQARRVSLVGVHSEIAESGLTPQMPSLCSSWSQSTIAQRVVCMHIFLLYSMLAPLFGFAFPYPGLLTASGSATPSPGPRMTHW